MNSFHYDPSTGTFEAAGNMHVPRSGPQATLLRNGDVLITGGFGYCGIGCMLGPLPGAELYHPAASAPSSAQIRRVP